MFVTIIMIFSACFALTVSASNSELETAVAENESVMEIEELREPNSETFLLADGTCEYSKNKYNNDDNNQLTEIVNTIAVPSFDIWIFYDYSCSSKMSEINSAYYSATNSLSAGYSIKFNLVSVSALASLDGSSCPNAKDNTDICNSACGALSACSSSHHRSDERLLKLSYSTSYYAYRLVGHALCYYNNGEHSESIGSGEVNGKNAITSIATSSNLARSIQHELTHNLGGSHATCNEDQKCVLQGNFGYWCDACRANILEHL